MTAAIVVVVVVVLVLLFTFAAVKVARMKHDRVLGSDLGRSQSPR